MENRSAEGRSSDESELLEAAQSILAEVDLSPIHSQRSSAARLVYTWALILERRAVWKLQDVIAAALRLYADSL